MQGVDIVVRLFELLDQPQVIALDRGQRLTQHVEDDIAYAQRLAHGAAERLRRRIEHAAVEMLGHRSIRRAGGRGKEPRHQLCERGQQRQKNQRDRKVEPGVKVEHQPGGI